MFICSDCLLVKSAGNAGIRFFIDEYHFCLIGYGLKHKACADSMKNTVWKCESPMLFYMFHLLNVPLQVYYVPNICIADLI